MHLDEETRQRLLHGELKRALEASARDHLAACAECRALVEAAERDEAEVRRLLRAADHEAPGLDAAQVAALARVPADRQGRWAAVLAATLVVAGAAYAAPGSPLREWIGEAWAGLGGRGSGPEGTSAVPHDSATSGVAVSPGASLVVVFATPAGQAQVTIWDGDELVVRAPTGAATFASDEGRLLINSSAPDATFDLMIPRTAPLVEVRAGERLLLKASLGVLQPPREGDASGRGRVLALGSAPD
jgi:anti-sigma factor RsiW